MLGKNSKLATLNRTISHCTRISSTFDINAFEALAYEDPSLSLPTILPLSAIRAQLARVLIDGKIWMTISLRQVSATQPFHLRIDNGAP